MKLIDFLAQKSRHVVEACGRKLGTHKSFGERPRVDGCSEKDVLLILNIISIAQVTSRGGIVSPGHGFNL